MFAFFAVLLALGFTFNIVFKMITEGVIWVIEWVKKVVEENS